MVGQFSVDGLEVNARGQPCAMHYGLCRLH